MAVFMSVVVGDVPFERSGDDDRVAGLGRLSAGAKMAMKPFVERVFTIFATNASVLRVIVNLQILLRKYAIYTM